MTDGDFREGEQIGSISLVNFPMTDGQRWKRRPVVCVATSADAPDAHATVVVCAITSSGRRGADPFTVQIFGWEAAGLDEPSWVQVDRLYTTQPVYFRGTLGRLRPEDLAAVLNSLSLLTSQRHNKEDQQSAGPG